MTPIKFIFFILCVFSQIYSKEMLILPLNEVKYGSLRNNEYDYYTLTLPKKFDNDNHLIIELEANKNLDIVNNILSDPNLYISMTEKMPSNIENTWKSDRFGDETISISPSFLNSSKEFYISVHCKERCNYVLKAQLVKNIILKENELNNLNLNPKTVTKFSFKTRNNFNELYVNVISSYINSFSTYLARENPSSSNTLPAIPILFNGYRFKIKKYNNLNQPNTNTEFNLIVDNENDKQELTIFLKYDNDHLLVKEADILYDSIQENTANCYYFPIDYFNKDKDIILSTSLFNGQGFIHISGFNPPDPSSIRISDKDKDENYPVIQNKAIRITKKNFEKYGTFQNDQQNMLHFCFYATRSASFSMKIYFLENYKRLQALNIIYAGIGIEDIIPKKSVKKYKMEHFNIKNDITLMLKQISGDPRLYLYMAKPEEENKVLETYDFEMLKRRNQVREAQKIHNSFALILTQESNKCIKNPITDQYNCFLDAVVECAGLEDCTYNIAFDHSKKEVIMQPSQTYSNVISENENDFYKIIIKDTSVKNLAIVLMQNTGKTLLRLDSFLTDIGGFDLNEEAQNNEFLPNLIKISNELFKTESLKGTFSVKVRGLSYASYSLYYYTFSNEEKEDALDQDKVTMKLEKGKIIRDIFMDKHKFKVYMYDTSTSSKKENLFIGLVETDYTNLELYIFKDLNDFSIIGDRITGFLWKGDYKDYVYIDKNDKKYLENDILYLLIFKKTSFKPQSDKNTYTSFYLGVTDETTPFLLNEGIEFKHQLNKEHFSQKFYYYFIDEEKKQDLQISFSLYFGHIIVDIGIENQYYMSKNIVEESNLINIPRSEIYKYCKREKDCGISVVVKNDNAFQKYSTFLISMRSSSNSPINLKQGVVNKRAILSGENQHFIIDLQPDKSFGAKITAFFTNGQGEIYVRRLLRSEMFKINNFPDEKNYEYFATYKTSNKGFYLIEIPYSDFGDHSHAQLLMTVRGIFPGIHSTKIEYTITVSNSINELVTDRNYRLFISKGEIAHFHFKVGINKKRLYISMTNKDQDANMYLNYDRYFNNINESDWKNTGSYNEYLDINIEEPFFIRKDMTDLDGDYYLAIQGIGDCFYNLYISTQDVKIITLAEGMPGGCICEAPNDSCYFRYENINNPTVTQTYKQKLIFYTEFTYGSGSISAKLYNNGNMDEILSSLPSKSNSDVFADDSTEFLFVDLNEDNPKYTLSSVLVLGIQCKQKSLFDLSAVSLDKSTNLARNENSLVFLKINQDNIFYLSYFTGLANKFVYYIYKNEDFIFQIKAFLGKANVHIYTNSTAVDYKFLEGDDRKINIKNYHHISDFEIDGKTKGKKEYYGKVSKQYGYRNYVYVEVKPIEDCLININLNYDNEMNLIPLNKEVFGIINNFMYDAYFDFRIDTDEVLLTVTSLEKDKPVNVYIKTNIVNKNLKVEEINKYSKASKSNYDLKGKTNPITSSISLKLKNAPEIMRSETSIVRILINIESETYQTNHKIKILVTPIVNSITRFKPQQNQYYFSGFEKKYSEKTIYTLKKLDDNDNLMVIEISSCKGNFIYALTDSPPLDSETYTQLFLRRVKSDIYNSNGKKIIIVRNIKEKEYYLTLYGANNKREVDLIIDEEKDPNQMPEGGNEVDVLFFYYTTIEKRYNYLVTNDVLKYESDDDFYSVKFTLPELKKRDTFGRENYVDSINYTFIVSDKKSDFVYMESTCYLSKLQQNNETNKFENLKIEFNKEKNGFYVEGLKAGKVYYMNVLGKNNHNGEVFTYKPVMITFALARRRAKIGITVLLATVFVVFFCAAFTIYRKYRLKKMQLSFIEENNMDNSINKRFGNSSNINLDFVKKKYNNLEEDNQKLSIND